MLLERFSTVQAVLTACSDVAKGIYVTKADLFSLFVTACFCFFMNVFSVCSAAFCFAAGGQDPSIVQPG